MESKRSAREAKEVEANASDGSNEEEKQITER